MSEFKSGYVKGHRRIKDRWVVRFERKNPGDKAPVWYVKLRAEAPEPKDGELMKFPGDQLKETEFHGQEAYEQVSENPRNANVHYSPTDHAENQSDEIPEVVHLDINTTAYLAAIAYDMSARATSPDLDEQAEIYMNSIIKLAAKKAWEIDKQKEISIY